MENWNKFLHVFLTGARSWSRRQNWSRPTTFEYNMNTLLWWWDAFFELDFSNLNRMKIGLPLIWFWLVATHVGSSESVYFFYILRCLFDKVGTLFQWQKARQAVSNTHNSSTVRPQLTRFLGPKKIKNCFQPKITLSEDYYLMGTKKM